MTDAITMGEEPRTARQRKAEATRARILSTALRLFDEQGYAATPTRQIAAEAEVSEGLIFRYFPTKIDLLRSQTERPTSFARAVDAVITEHGDAPIDHVVDLILDEFARSARGEARNLQMFIGDARVDESVHDAFRSIMADTVGTIAGYLSRRVAAGELRPDLACDSAASQLVGALLLFALTHSHVGQRQWEDLATRYTRDLATTWVHGVEGAGPARDSDRG